MAQTVQVLKIIKLICSQDKYLWCLEMYLKNIVFSIIKYGCLLWSSFVCERHLCLSCHYYLHWKSKGSAFVNVIFRSRTFKQQSYWRDSTLPYHSKVLMYVSISRHRNGKTGFYLLNLPKADQSCLREREQNYAGLSKMLSRFCNVLNTHCFPSENILFICTVPVTG